VNDEKIKQELQKPLGAALLPIEWFVLFTFVDHAMKQDNMFATSEDADSLSKTMKRLHDQVFPPKKDTLVELEEQLGIKPKEIIKPSSTLIV
jgi:hypothetical protein